jgi:hypothetical protein
VIYPPIPWRSEFKLVIAGSRGIRLTLNQMDKAIYQFANSPAVLWAWPLFRSRVVVVSGEAEGPDSVGREWAIQTGRPVIREPVTQEDYNRHGRYLGPKMRNRRMAEIGDGALCLWDGHSGGTADMAMRMIARQKPVVVVPMKADGKR